MMGSTISQRSGGIDLDVAAALGGEHPHLLADQLSGVTEHLEGVGIRCPTVLGGVHRIVIIGLGRVTFTGFHARPRVGELRRGDHLLAPQLSGDRLGALELDVVAIGGLEWDRLRWRLRQPLDGSDQRIEERAAAHLAVAHHIQSSALLECDRLIDRAVLDLLEVSSAELRAREGDTCLLQILRP